MISSNISSVYTIMIWGYHHFQNVMQQAYRPNMQKREA